MKPVILCILDGVGIRKDRKGNAFKQAKTPNFDYLWNNYPHCTLEASGEAVGIPKGQMGNSEVGHTNIGAGRVVYQSFVRINNDIKNKDFFKNEALLGAINNCRNKNSNLHILTMVSDGGIHSHINHLKSLLDLCKKENFDRVYIHAILDGRDTAPMVAPKFITELEKKIDEVKIGKIVTIGGRYYIMNRDRNWDLTKMGYEAVMNGISDINAKNTQEAFDREYKEDLTDEFMKPTVIHSMKINPEDSMIMANFRSDRMIQMLRALKDPDFKEFKRRDMNDLYLVTMTDYEDYSNYKNIHIAYEPDKLVNTMGEYVSNLGLKQLRLSEFEKSSHVTFYYSGLKNDLYKNESRKIFDRPKVFTYDEDPKMRCYDIENFLAQNASKYDFIVLNFPNGDALGHTGIYPKVVEGVEHLDKALGRLLEDIDNRKYDVIITADHGNCEIMLDENGEPNKKHTTSVVPFIILNKRFKLDANKVGKLADIAPTICSMMGLEVPKEMTGEVLVTKKQIKKAKK